MLRINTTEYDLASTNADANTVNIRSKTNDSNYYNNCLSYEYDNFIKQKSNKLRRKSQALLDKLNRINHSDNEINDHNFVNKNYPLLLSKSNLTGSTSNTVESSSCYETISQHDHFYESQSQHDTYSSVRF